MLDVLESFERDLARFTCFSNSSMSCETSRLKNWFKSSRKLVFNGTFDGAFEACAVSLCDFFTGGSVFCSLAACAANSAGFTLPSLNRDTRALWRAPVFDKFLKCLNSFVAYRKSSRSYSYCLCQLSFSVAAVFLFVSENTLK